MPLGNFESVAHFDSVLFLIEGSRGTGPYDSVRHLTNTVAVAQKPLVCLSDAVGIYVISVDMSSLMQASEAITTSMTHPFGLQTVAKAKYKRSFLAKNSFAWMPSIVTVVFSGSAER